MKRSLADSLPAVTTATGPLTVVETDKARRTPDEFGTLPDISLPSDLLIWRSPLCSGLLVELPPGESRFAIATAAQIATGLRGRGTCQVLDDGDLFVSFGVTKEEADSGRLLRDYERQLLIHLNLDRDAIKFRGTETVYASDDATRVADAAIRALGLRAIRTQKTD